MGTKYQLIFVHRETFGFDSPNGHPVSPPPLTINLPYAFGTCEAVLQSWRLRCHGREPTPGAIVEIPVHDIMVRAYSAKQTPTSFVVGYEVLLRDQTASWPFNGSVEVLVLIFDLIPDGRDSTASGES